MLPSNAAIGSLSGFPDIQAGGPKTPTRPLSERSLSYHGVAKLFGADLAQAAAEDTYHHGGVVLIVSGRGTGRPTDLARVPAVREAVPAAPVLLGSGVTTDGVAPMAAASEGAIVGSAMQWDGLGGNSVDLDRAAHLVVAWRAARGDGSIR